MRHLLFGAACLAATANSLSADVTIWEDDFESYASDFDLWQTWEPANGDGSVPAPIEIQDAGILSNNNGMFPGIAGQALAHIGGIVNQWNPFPEFFDPVNQDDKLEPTEEQSIVFGGDVFLASSNSRLSVGLRSNDSVNLLEIGGYNTDARTFAYRLSLFDSGDVNWQYFDLPLNLDSNQDGNVTLIDIGPAWHRFQATITPSDVTFELDVLRDGSVDAMSVVPATIDSAMFDSFRIGGPSGLTSTAEGAFDNVFLRLVDLVPSGEGIPGDYNNNGQVEQGDLDLVLLGWGVDGTPPPAGWINQLPEGNIDQAELDGVLLNWGNSAAQLTSVASVPEPSAAILLAIGLALVFGTWRRGRRLLHH